MQTLTIDVFLYKANVLHNYLYDYSNVIYKNINSKIEIICKIHGVFLQRARDHLYSEAGCPKCALDSRLKLRRSTTQEFINKAQKIHKNIYDYSLVEYINARTPVIIICKIHGQFEQNTMDHIRGATCPKCAQNIINFKLSLTLEEFCKMANDIHTNKYNYSNVKYKNNKTKIAIICNIHGIFYQTPHNHLLGQGCKKCGYFNCKQENEWLNSLNIIDDTRHRQVCINVGKNRFYVDGFNPEAKIVYEFNGDFWHGNPKIYNQNDINPATKTTFGELYAKTLIKKAILENDGYKVISIWESDWNILCA